ncbi:alpha/beta hydrolase [Acidiferrimicrobium sp. IK]|uniref:alpha/beta hydrolase n=1 Tax=Acidiferrimicrobium sp. IK TaxID=2871700 RepID=UPI0021CB2085|nr:alpha/beta hydrolase [Acidiferrimicrobium sp. IK]MCU4183481.1 alpha/beta hydrolase [Acidiferrimicrobium sp. IK]
MRQIDLNLDVPSPLALAGQAHAAVTVILPDAAALPGRPVVCFGFPGGGYGRRYYTFDMPGASSGGEAGWHARRGWIFVACDHLGVGDSWIPPTDTLDYESIAETNRVVVGSVLERLAAGGLADGFPAITDPVTIGLGQSMGGCFTIVLQAHHRVFDAVGILGYSAIHTSVPSRPGQPIVPMPWVTRRSDMSDPVILNPEDLAAPVPAEPGDGAANPWSWAFHYDDEPAEVVAADMRPADPLPAWKSATIPACALKMVAPGTVSTEAAAIRTPVLIAAGERDVMADPRSEPRAYISSPDITVVVVPRMAHMHNFASTREVLWSRIQSWGDAVAAAVATPGGA